MGLGRKYVIETLNQVLEDAVDGGKIVSGICLHTFLLYVGGGWEFIGKMDIYVHENEKESLKGLCSVGDAGKVNHGNVTRFGLMQQE